MPLQKRADEFLRRAVEARAQAAMCDNPELKADWLRVSDGWEFLAREALAVDKETPH